MTRTDDILSRDVFDSRDVINRIDELLEARDEGGFFGDDEREELRALDELKQQFGDYGDWMHGETIIADSYFRTYAEDLARDIGAVNDDATWPNNHINWEAAARDLKMDYTSAEVDGKTYWMRA